MGEVRRGRLGIHAVQLEGRQMRLLGRQLASRGGEMGPGFPMTHLQARRQPLSPRHRLADLGLHLGQPSTLLLLDARRVQRFAVCPFRQFGTRQFLRQHALGPVPPFARPCAIFLWIHRISSPLAFPSLVRYRIQCSP